jgi:membrane glycosyltransferase
MMVSTVALPGIRLFCRRLIIFLAVLIPLIWVDIKLYKVLSSGGVNSIDIIVLILFSLCITHLLFSFVLAVVGFFISVFKLNPITLKFTSIDKFQPSMLAKGNFKIGMAVPVYKEDLEAVIERLASLIGELKAIGWQDRIDFHLLSDSSADYEVREREIWEQACKVLNCKDYLFYRRRTNNEQKKAGNVHEFLVRNHAVYKYFCVLDADSTMTAKSLLTMLQIMEMDSSVGIVQSVPFSIRGESLFARMLEWNSLTYSRLFGNGFAFWQGCHANYYGHNALIRTAAFWQHCKLPLLPGRPPFGGQILSHDFVESALMIKNGYRVLMLPEIPGSYEEIPNTVAQFLIRDRRWMLGNLQHLKVAYHLALTPFCRFQLFYGAYCYLASILWFLFLIAATLQSIYYQEPHVYFSMPHQLFPNWPVSQAVATFAIYVLTLGLIVVPKLLGLIERFIVLKYKFSLIGIFNTVISFIVEFFSTVLLAPIVMLFHVRFFTGFITGRQVAWDPQQRGLDKQPLSNYFSNYGWLSVIGIIWFGLIIWSESPLVWWIIPVLVPLILAPFFTYLIEQIGVLRWVLKRNLFAVDNIPRVTIDWNQ